MSYRVIALDLDGTLLNSEKQILPESIEAIKKAQQQGIHVLIATGRHHSAILPIYRALSLTSPVICCNGAYLYDYQQKTVIEGEPMARHQAEIILDLLQDANIDPLLYADDNMYYCRPTEHVLRTQKWGQQFAESLRPRFVQVHNMRSVVQQAEYLWKFALCHSDPEKLQQFVELAIQATEVSCEWSWQDQVDIARQGNSKGKRLTRWVTAQGMTMQQVMAFGDNENDISMLEAAGLGIAMGNATLDVKQRAQLTARNNDSPTIAEMIERYALHP